MKKIIALLLAAIMVMSMAACNNSGNKETDPAETTAPAEAPNDILTNVWNSYADDEKFAIIGGNMELNVMDAPAAWDMAMAENLSYNLLIPADLVPSVEDAASMIHMMNANTFTCGAVKLAEGTDEAAFASAMRDAIQGNMWMCGFPERLLIASVRGCVVMAFGLNDAMNPFQEKLTAAYGDLTVLYDEAIAG